MIDEAFTPTNGIHASLNSDLQLHGPAHRACTCQCDPLVVHHVSGNVVTSTYLPFLKLKHGAHALRMKAEGMPLAMKFLHMTTAVATAALQKRKRKMHSRGMTAACSLYIHVVHRVSRALMWHLCWPEHVVSHRQKGLLTPLKAKLHASHIDSFLVDRGIVCSRTRIVWTAVTVDTVGAESLVFTNTSPASNLAVEYLQTAIHSIPVCRCISSRKPEFSSGCTQITTFFTRQKGAYVHIYTPMPVAH